MRQINTEKTVISTHKAVISTLKKHKKAKKPKNCHFEQLSLYERKTVKGTFIEVFIVDFCVELTDRLNWRFLYFELTLFVLNWQI